MASEAKAGFVVGDNGEIYVQLPADNQFGFVICDEDQSWDGGVGSGLKSWTLLERDDERITNADRMRLDWVLDEWIDENRPVVEVCSCTEWVREKLDFPFATDGESGTLRAESFEDACEQLELMFTEEALADGAWGWVEDGDGERFKIGSIP